MTPQREFADPSEEESTASISSSNNPSTETNVEVTILEAPNWDEDASNFADREKTTFKRLMSWGPLFTIFITLTIGICTVFVLIDLSPPFESIGGFISFSLHLIFSYLMSTNFLRAAAYGPGYIRYEWRPANSDHERKLQYCPVCKGFKAPRSHHCSQCNRCVLKMEHHCPWINNCVGHRNHALFVKFMTFAVLGCGHAILICLPVVISSFMILFGYTSRRPLPVKSVYSLIAALTSSCLGTGVFIAVGLLLWFQVYSVIRLNKTSVEEYICLKADARKRKKPFVYPYDLGWKRNFIDVLWNGDFPKGNGVWWPVRSDCTQFTFTEEQILQKRLKSQCAKIRTVIKEYNGGKGLETCRIGLRTFFCQPWTDGRRIDVHPGDKYAITRGNAHWVYGRYVELRKYIDEEGNVQYEYVPVEHLRRGWFPRACTEAKKKAPETSQKEE